MSRQHPILDDDLLDELEAADEEWVMQYFGVTPEPPRRRRRNKGKNPDRKQNAKARTKARKAERHMKTALDNAVILLFAIGGFSVVLADALNSLATMI